MTSPVPIEGDFEGIVKSMADYTPAFIVEAVGRAVRYAVDRTNGELPEQFTSEDIVKAADGLRPQYELMIGDVEKTPSELDAAFKRIVSEVTRAELEEAL